jgi:tetratricopeptide (TPR) repeat protein
MPEANPTPIGLPHVVFLERAAREFDSSPGKFGQAAFLVLRLVDLLASSHEPGPQDDLFGYQAAATGRYCNEQLEPGKAAECLQELVRTASYAHRRRETGRIAPAMLSLATHLEDSTHYVEALDVLTTLERVAAGGIAPAHAVAVALQSGRVQRKIARFEEADAAYERAEALATAAGDTASVLLSRLGRANVFWGRGNLTEAERWNREALRDARTAGLRAVQARAEHGLGTVLGARGQVPDAVPYLWQAYERYEDENQALRALHDLGLALARLGAVDGAERALRVVVAKDVSPENVISAKIELMHCASFRRDRIGFERWRSECARDADTMPPNNCADYHLKVGIGLARFGQIDRAAVELRHAMDDARAHRLHEFEFRIERILSGIYDCCTTASPAAEPTETPAWATSISEVSTALAGIAG